MAQSSARRKASLVADPTPSYRLVDVIEVKVSYGAPAPGFILVPDGFRPPSPESLVGEVVVVHSPGASDNRYSFPLKIAAVRTYGTTTSMLVENWPADYPPPQAGWSIQVPNANGPSPDPPKPEASKKAG